MTTNSASQPRYSIVVPVFNEQAVLPVLLRRLDTMMAGLDGAAETIFIDDGSADCSAIILRAKANQIGGKDSALRCDNAAANSN